MGIDSFSTFLKKYAPQSYFEIPLESIRGKRVAIDMNNLIYIMMSTSIKEMVSRTNLADSPPDRDLINQKTLDRILFRLEIFLQYGITPVCIFDGKPIPLKQQHAKVKRDKRREQIKTKLTEAEHRLYSTEPLLRNQYLINEYEKYYKQDVDIPYDFIEQLKDIVQTSGFPVLRAEDFNFKTNDAEALCASLCLTGNNYCFAGMTTDSDFHTYGGNIAITDIELRNRIQDGHRIQMHYATIRSLEAILQQTGLSFDSFQDLCILMGTDFNPNIPNIGPVKSWNLIQRGGNIPYISQFMDVSILNHPEVKQVFTSTLKKLDIPDPNFNQKQFREHGRNTFDLYGMRDHASIINGLLSQFDLAEVEISEKPQTATNSLFDSKQGEELTTISL